MKNPTTKRMLVAIISFSIFCHFAIAQEVKELSKEERTSVIEEIEKKLGVSDNYKIPDLSNDLFLSTELGTKREDIKNRLDSIGYKQIREHVYGEYVHELECESVNFLGVKGKFSFSFDKDEKLTNKIFSFEWDNRTTEVPSGKKIKKKDIDANLEKFKKYVLRIINYVDSTSEMMLGVSHLSDEVQKELNNESFSVNSGSFNWVKGELNHSIILSNMEIFGITTKSCQYIIGRFDNKEKNE